VNYQVGSKPAEDGRAIAEQVAYLRTGIDGLFTDQPDIGVVARSQFEQFAAAGASRLRARARPPQRSPPLQTC